MTCCRRPIMDLIATHTAKASGKLPACVDPNQRTNGPAAARAGPFSFRP